MRVRRRACSTNDSERAQAGGAATIGAQETLGALAAGRVDHLILHPDHDFSLAAGMIPRLIEGPGERRGERAVEAAIGDVGAGYGALERRV